jgi:hypothetical protein
LQAAIEVATGAAKGVAHVAGQAVSRGEEERAASQGRGSVGAVTQLRIGGNPEPSPLLLAAGLNYRLGQRARTGALESRQKQRTSKDDGCVLDARRDQSLPPG